MFSSAPTPDSVIPTEAAHSLIVSGAAEGPPHLSWLLFVFAVILSHLANL
jgi:hypothetical protein